MLRVFGDESHDETRQRVFALAGLLGSEADWNDVVARWEKRTGSRVFHASDCETTKGEFASDRVEDNKALYKDLTTIIAESRLLGFGAAIDLAGMRSVFRESLEGTAHYMCFDRVAAHFAECAYLSVPRDVVQFTFDHHLEADYNIRLLYGGMKETENLTFGSYLADTIEFATRDDTRIQAADLVARETMKHLDNMIGPVQRPKRRSMDALEKTGRFRFHFFVREYFESMNAKMARIEEAAGFSMESYRQWLLRQKGKPADNWSNRIRYLLQFEAMERVQRNLGR